MPLSYREGASSVNCAEVCTTSDSPSTAKPPLVNSSISQQSSAPPRTKAFFDNFDSFEIFKRDLRINKKFRSSVSGKEGSNKRKIDCFSSSSRRRLRHVAANCCPDIKSQFLLTFHKAVPTDGRTVKRLLNNFLNRLRNKYSCHYLWVMEFTRKGNPHIHLYLTCEKSHEIQEYLAKSWNRICQESPEHLAVHLHHKNMIDWDMGSGRYVCKYLEKHYQKNVPDSFLSVGRFWGCSRGFVPPAFIESLESINEKVEPQIDLTTGELPQQGCALKFIYRTLRKYHEARVQYFHKLFTGKKRKFRSGIIRFKGSLITNGAIIFKQTMEYLICKNPPLPF